MATTYKDGHGAVYGPAEMPEPLHLDGSLTYGFLWQQDTRDFLRSAVDCGWNLRGAIERMSLVNAVIGR